MIRRTHKECWGEAYAILIRVVRAASLSGRYLSQNVKEVGK